MDTVFCVLAAGIATLSMPCGKKKVWLILHNVRSAHNVGSIFRTADAIGVTRIYLTGYTPAPIDRFGRVRKDMLKVSLGAEKYVPWEVKRNLASLLRLLSAKGVSLIALEQDSRSVDYKKVKTKTPVALIMGSEVGGLSRTVLKLCDSIAEIPMRGHKESLNVSVAAGIALFRFFDND